MTESRSPEGSRSTSTPDWLGMARTASKAMDLGADAGGSALLREFLLIGLNETPYAIPVERVREIVRYRELTRVPRAPNWLLGVIALRGEVVQVVDLRRRIGVEVTDPGRSSRIIVLHGDANRVTGVLVDSVRDVYRVEEDGIQAADDLDLSAVAEFCQRDGAFISILDLDIVLEFTDA